MADQSCKKERIAVDLWLPIIMQGIDQGKKIELAPWGNSMYPFLVNQRDKVILKKIDINLKKGDICLYRREDGTHVLHALHHTSKKGYYFLGDSQTWIEGPLKREQILAVAESLIRKNKVVPCSSKRYRILHRTWMRLRLLRPIMIRGWWFIRNYK